MSTDESGKSSGARPSVGRARTTRGHAGSAPSHTHAQNHAHLSGAPTPRAHEATPSARETTGRAQQDGERETARRARLEEERETSGEHGADNEATTRFGKRTAQSAHQGENREAADGRGGHRPFDMHANETPSRRNDYYEPLFDGRGDQAARAIRRWHDAKRIAAVVGIAAAVICAVVFIGGAIPMTVRVNGADIQVPSSATAQTAFEAAGSPAEPGNLVDVEGAVIAEGKGHPFSFARNGRPEDDPKAKLAKGDAITFSKGGDIEEESDAQESPIPPVSADEGTGALHVLASPGEAGVAVTKTGKISGKTVTQEKTPAKNREYRRYNPDVGDDKVIALTFDDGPWDTTTAQVLDVLKENGAKATFFTVGNRINGEGVDLVAREAAEGHQVCTHTWSHASGEGQGVNLGFMSASDQRSEVERGMQAIADATGNAASTVIRAPGGNFSTEVWDNVSDLISAEIGWNIDTGDWRKPGVDSIVDQLKSAQPGDVVLMHDGGGDRSQTVDALREALPYLKEQGFSFITIDELLKYPPAE